MNRPFPSRPSCEMPQSRRAGLIILGRELGGMRIFNQRVPSGQTELKEGQRKGRGGDASFGIPPSDVGC